MYTSTTDSHTYNVIITNFTKSIFKKQSNETIILFYFDVTYRPLHVVYK